MRGSAKKPPRCIRENAGVRPTPWESARWATLPLCSHITTQLHFHPVSFQLQLTSNLASSRADIPLPKIPFPRHPPASPFSTTQSPPSVSLTRPLLALPPALPWFSSTPTQPFKSSCSPLLPSLVPASPPAQALDPTATGDQPQRAAGSHTHHCQPGSASGELQGEQRRASGRTKCPMPCRAALEASPVGPPQGSQEPRGAEGLPEHLQTAPAP